MPKKRRTRFLAAGCPGCRGALRMIEMPVQGGER
jgi:hypothetical protein